MKLKNEYNNKVAKKFRLIIDIIQIIGYIISGLIFVAALLDLNLYCLIYGVIVALSTWFSTLFLEAIAEIIELLDNIKNK